jgi:dipeptidyl aminopeptidase/acylaminoacyl peptidase
MFRPLQGVEHFEPRTLLSVALVSVNGAGTNAGDSSSLFGDAGASRATSVPAAQTSTALSSDGSLMVFQSDATDLVAGSSASNGATNVFVRNVSTGQTQLISAAPGGAVANGRSFDPVISPNGRYVAFLSTATNLSTIAANPPSSSTADGTGLLYVRDLQTGTTTLLDATPGGQAGNGLASDGFVFSPDSTRLAFADSSTNLTSTPPPATTTATGAATDNVYLFNLAAGTTSAVSVTPGGTLSSGNATTTPGNSDLVFSPDGTQLAFVSTATDLTSAGAATTPAPTPVTNVYVTNLSTGTMTLVSGTAGGQIADGSATQPVFSPDGSRLAFLSTANDLTAAAPSASTNEELFLRNLASGTTTAVSVTPGNTLSAGTVTQMVFSPNSQLLGFVSTGTDLTANPPDTPLAATMDSSGPSLPTWYASNAFVYNLASGMTTAGSVTPSGELSDGFVGDLSFTPDSQSLAYLSSADDLTTNPTPPISDMAPTDSFPSPLPNAPPTPPANLFLTNLSSGSSTLVSVTPTGTLSSGNVVSYAISPDGSKVAFDAVATDLTNNPPTVSAAPATVAASSSVVDNVFLRDLTAATTTLISAAPGGTLSSDPAFEGSEPLIFSPDSQTLYFSTGAALATGDTNNTSDIYAATAPFANPGEIHFATWQFDANTGSGQAVITVVRNAPLDSPSTVDYSEQDVTTRAGSDYVATSGTLNFAAGQASATFTIPLNASDAFSGTRTATITLANPTGGSLGFSTATLNLTGVLPVVPVTITASSTAATKDHTHKHAHTPTPTPTPTSDATTSPSATAATTTPTPTPAPSTAGTTTVTVYTAPVTTTSGAANNSVPLTTGSNTPSSTSGNSTPTPTPTPTPATSAASTPSTTTAASTAGPIVSSLALRTTRHRVTSVIVNFSKPVAGTAAENTANYGVHLLNQGHRTKQGVRMTTVGRAVGISSATSDSSGETVTLTLSTPLRSGQMFQLRVNGGAGGITDKAGNPLNSPSAGTPGSDFDYNVN